MGAASRSELCQDQSRATAAGPSPATPDSSATEWVGRLGVEECDPCAALTPAERIAMVWPITVTAWAFSGTPCHESRLRRDVEGVVRRKR